MEPAGVEGPEGSVAAAAAATGVRPPQGGADPVPRRGGHSGAAWRCERRHGEREGASGGGSRGGGPRNGEREGRRAGRAPYLGPVAAAGGAGGAIRQALAQANTGRAQAAGRQRR